MRCPQCGHDEDLARMSPSDWLDVFGPVVAIAPVAEGLVIEAAEQRFRIVVEEDGSRVEPLPLHP